MIAELLPRFRYWHISHGAAECRPVRLCFRATQWQHSIPGRSFVTGRVVAKTAAVNTVPRQRGNAVVELNSIDVAVKRKC